ncbi:MAG: CinA family protein [Victivallales bacterium]|nr:CinA family protein [Victivallales bacterium]
MNINEKIEAASEKLGALLKARGLVLSTAESCTGGGIAAAVTDVAGSSEWFSGAFVTYSNQWKMRQLGVASETLDRFGAVSAQTVSQMLEGLLKNGGADLGIAVSGIAGPGGGTLEKPVGTVFIGIAGNGWQVVRRMLFAGDRASVRAQTIETALTMMTEAVAQLTARR